MPVFGRSRRSGSGDPVSRALAGSGSDDLLPALYLSGGALTRDHCAITKNLGWEAFAIESRYTKCAGLFST